MRLFIGIKTGCEQELLEMQSMLKKAGRGNFTHTDNLHLTLRFLGEVERTRLGDIRKAMAKTQGAPFSLACGGIGTFGNGRIVFAKVGGETTKLCSLVERLETALEGCGFAREPRKYHPHITLVRQYRADAGVDVKSIKTPQCRFDVCEMILFESRRENGRLVYAPLFTHKLVDG